MSKLRTVLGLGLFFGLGACASAEGPWIWVYDAHRQLQDDTIQPNDVLAVTIANQPQMSGNFPVRPDGTYTQPLLGSLKVGGLTPTAAEVLIQQRLQGVIVNPKAQVSVGTPAAVRVSVAGEVQTGGEVTLRPGEGMLEVMARVRGITPYASRNSIYVIRQKPKYLRVRFDYDAILGGDPYSISFRLRDGDVIVVE